MKILISILICISTIVCLRTADTKPNYEVEFSEKFGIPMWYMRKFKMAESSGISTQVSHKNAYGWYQITEATLQHYCYLSGNDRSRIRDAKSFLINEYNNTYIFCYMASYWLSEGYQLKDVAQIWLWGIGNFKKGRYSKTFNDKIML